MMAVAIFTVLMGDKKFCDANPELVAKFLRVFLRSANMLQKETPESLAPEYCRFFQEFVGKSFTPEMAALDIKTHPVFNLEEQLALFDDSKGQSKAAKWMADIAAFFAGVGRITPDELKEVERLVNEAIAAGVDITAGYRAVELMKKHVARTVTPGVIGGLGGFGGLFRPDLAGMKSPVLVSGTDGVGTKLKICLLYTSDAADEL